MIAGCAGDFGHSMLGMPSCPYPARLRRLPENLMSRRSSVYQQIRAPRDHAFMLKFTCNRPTLMRASSTLAATAGGPVRNTAAPAPDLHAPALVRWSAQELRRVATYLTQAVIQYAHVITLSPRLGAQQAVEQRSYLKRKVQV